MKAILTVIALTFLTIHYGIAQEEKLISENITSIRDMINMRGMDLPAFRGGQEAIANFVSEKIEYPKLAFRQGVEGVVMVNFRISKEGKILNPYVSQSVHPELDKEALRLVNNMPNWIPAMQNGEPREVAYQLPIVFELKN
jgi:protein TonB